MRPRTFGHEYVYGIEHLERFPEQYERIEHRFKLADIDWCEFCGYCHKPVMICEMRNEKRETKPSGLDDKPTTVMGHLARGIGIPVYAVGVYTYRPPEVQAEIDQLNARILELVRQWPMTRIRAQVRTPHRGEVITYDPPQWWDLVALQHSDHHQDCVKAQRSHERLAGEAWLAKAPARHRGLYTPNQPLLIEGTG